MPDEGNLLRHKLLTPNERRDQTKTHGYTRTYAGARRRVPRVPALSHVVVRVVGRFRGGGLAWSRPAEDGEHAIDRHDKQPVVVLELDGNRLARIEQDLVVLANRLVFVVLDRFADSDHPAGDDRDLVRVGQDDAALGLALVVVLAHDDALSDWLDDVVFVLGAALGRLRGPMEDCRRGGGTGVGL